MGSPSHGGQCTQPASRDNYLLGKQLTTGCTLGSEHTNNGGSVKNLVLLPAMLCDEELYADQIGRLGGLVESSVAIATKTSMAENAAAVLRSAPARFILAGTAYGASLALEIVATAPARVAGLWPDYG